MCLFDGLPRFEYETRNDTVMNLEIEINPVFGRGFLVLEIAETGLRFNF